MKQDKYRAKVQSCEFGIFDLDGTLVDSRKLFRFLGVRLASKFFSLKPKEASFSSRGVPLSPRVKKVYNTLKIHKLVKPINHLSHSLEQKGTPIKGAGSLKHLDQTLYCSSKSPLKAAKTRLKNNGLLELFSLVLGRKEGTKREHLVKFAELNSLSLTQFARKAYFVSDGPADLNLCQREKLNLCVGVETTLGKHKLKQAGADWVISDLAQLHSN